MSAVELKVGDIVPLRLTLIDGDTAKYPQAFVYGPTNSLLSTESLTHAANGMYASDNSYVMPNVAFITVVYKTFSDAGHTTESTVPSHGRASDSFNRKDESLAAIADSVWDEALAGHVTAGSAGANQNLIDEIPSNPVLDDDARLDYLDASVASRESEASASSRASTNLTEHNATQSALDELEEATAPTAAAIADAVWDELLSEHITAYTAGRYLKEIGDAIEAGEIDSTPSSNIFMGQVID